MTGIAPFTKSEAQELAEDVVGRRTRIRELEEERDDLDAEAQRLGECLYDLKTHVENARKDAFDYPDTVWEILDHAEDLLEGRTGKKLRSRAELKDQNQYLEARIEALKGENEQLRTGLEQLRSYNADIRDGKINYRPEDHIQVADNALDYDLERPSRADYRHEVRRLEQENTIFRDALEHIQETSHVPCSEGALRNSVGSAAQDALDRAEDGRDE